MKYLACLSAIAFLIVGPPAMASCLTVAGLQRCYDGAGNESMVQMRGNLSSSLTITSTYNAQTGERTTRNSMMLGGSPVIYAPVFGNSVNSYTPPLTGYSASYVCNNKGCWSE